MAKKTIVDQPVETFYPSEIVNIETLKPWASNYNMHQDGQLSYMRRSLADFGQFKNIVVWGDYIVAGHGLVEAVRCLVRIAYLSILHRLILRLT